MSETYIPEAGDLVWFEFDSQAGHEQKGRRPALVISPASYNSKAGLMICCPITSKAKGYPFEVPIEADEVSGVVLADQVRTLDWAARRASKAGKATTQVLQETRLKIKALLEI